MKTTRAYCHRCSYPQSTCLCEHIQPIHCQSRIIVMQHPSESMAAKNTARLAALCLANVEIWIGENSEDFANLQTSIAEFEANNYWTFTLYPNQESHDINTVKKQQANQHKPLQLIFLDGTWRKAYKMWQLNQWLHRYPSLSITQMPSQYYIRKAPKEGCLATIEAIDYCLQHFENIDTANLKQLFFARQQQFVQQTTRTK